MSLTSLQPKHNRNEAAAVSSPAAAVAASKEVYSLVIMFFRFLVFYTPVRWLSAHEEELPEQDTAKSSRVKKEHATPGNPAIQKKPLLGKGRGTG